MPKTGHPALPGTRTSPRNKAKRRARTSNNGEPETPAAQANRRRKAAIARDKAAAGERAKPPKATEVQENAADRNIEEDDPVEIFTTKPPKKRVAPPAGCKKRKQFAPKKAVVKSRKDIEEIDDDSTYSGDEVDEEEDKSSDSKDGEGKRGADVHDESLALDESSSDNNDDRGRMLRFEQDVAKTQAEAAERHCRESNLSAQQGVEDPPIDTTPMADISTATRGLMLDLQFLVQCQTRSRL